MNDAPVIALGFCCREGVKDVKCQGCGAPLGLEDRECEYCGLVTPYGERLLEERRIREREEIRKHEAEREHRQQEHEHTPIMRKVSVMFVAVMYAVTFGYYAPFWYCTRSASINGLKSEAKFPFWATVTYFVLCLAFFFLPGFYKHLHITEEQGVSAWSLIIIAIPIMSIWLAVRVGKIFRQHSAKYIGEEESARTIAPSTAMLVLAGPLYLQYTINKMIQRNILMPAL